ncbi:MAG: FAD-dependent oxidoreductase [Endomicrobia bacterium]|nr:FAD-dependent oxidoreductase [Endomicrobiia bacterium]MDW8055444.1 FAD-dependent oxidoreductase [Elusimicrobiota bacterium]
MKVVILGGGLTGLTSAYELQKKGIDYTVIEKEPTVGGLCRSVTIGDFIFDYTGHFLHFDKSYKRAKEFVSHILSGNIIKLTRNSKIYTKYAQTRDNLIPYPFQLNIKYLKPAIRKECLQGLAWSNILKSNKVNKNFKQWLIDNFGGGITKYFFEPYNRKIWNVSLDEISTTWVQKFVPRIDFETVFNNLIFGTGTGEKYGYNFEFYYPKNHGIQSLVNGIYKHLNNHKVLTSAEVVRVNTKRKQVLFIQNDKIQSLKYDYLISTIPLPELLKVIDLHGLKKHINNLRYVSVICFNIAVNRPIMPGIHWIYFPDTDIIFYRIGFYHNVSKNLVRQGCGSIYVEVAVQDINKTNIDALLKKVKKQLVNIKTLNSTKEILFTNTLLLTYAYVIYDHYREKFLPYILQKLRTHKIYSIGRYGAWKYSYMTENIKDAVETVALI